MSYQLLGLGADPDPTVFRQLPECPPGQINDPVLGTCRDNCPPGQVPVPGGCADGSGVAGGGCSPGDLSFGGGVCIDPAWLLWGGFALAVGALVVVHLTAAAAPAALAYYGRPPEMRGWTDEEMDAHENVIDGVGSAREHALVRQARAKHDPYQAATTKRSPVYGGAR